MKKFDDVLHVLPACYSHVVWYHYLGAELWTVSDKYSNCSHKLCTDKCMHIIAGHYTLQHHKH